MSSEKDKSHYWMTMLECIDHGIRGDSAQCREWAEKFLAELEKHGDGHAAGILNGLLADPAGRREAALRASGEWSKMPEGLPRFLRHQNIVPLSHPPERLHPYYYAKAPNSLESPAKDEGEDRHD